MIGASVGTDHTLAAACAAPIEGNLPRMQIIGSCDTSTPDAAGSGPAVVYFDGGCPVCSREIAAYRARADAASLVWVDANAPGALGPGLTRDAALARLHVRRADGSLVGGAAAFAEIWSRVPGLRWLGRLLRLPLPGRAAELAYRGFLRLRRAWR